MSMNMLQLPAETLLHILSYVDAGDRHGAARLASVHPKLYSIAHDHTLVRTACMRKHRSYDFVCGAHVQCITWYIDHRQKDRLKRALWTATENGQLEYVRLITTCDLITDHDKAHSLWQATKDGQVECVRLILFWDSITDDVKGWALETAVDYGQLECVRLLLACDSITDEYKSIALHNAAENGQLECLRLLEAVSLIAS